ncbi:cop9 signalosome complex subunit [Tritrichomonas foetus]|uniref:Cop9 signalosome complex subunit n=1 Tax=Tritrichomonas foetus TaxID=1144522 RepID=A0A1J4JDX1_9EUKA|nr:cop9 signalosome complex subunit [Tritrichomonas foetus]|eukprot:OHS96487.1 cop9 signalosome complex subunit [Tritrichomonas foetus]
MSDEEIYFESDDGDEQQVVEDYQEADYIEEDTLDTPEKKYKAAKDSVGFDDYFAIDTFYDVYCDETAREKIRRKSLKKAAITLSQHDDDIERILGALTDICQAYEDKFFDKDDLFETVTGMLSNLMKSNSALLTFLEAATEKVKLEGIDQTFFIDLKLRQCELMMLNQDYEKAKEYLTEIQPMLHFPPKEDDIIMCSSCIRFLTIKIEFADLFNREDKMINLFRQSQNISQVSLSTNQKALLTKIEGIVLLKERKFKEAKEQLFKSFELFDEVGSVQRVRVIPYCALAEMLTRGLMSLFMNPKVIPFKQHEKVMAIEQLYNAYMSNNILRYNELIEPASKLFSDNPFYHQLILEIRQYVLRGALFAFCRSFQRVGLNYAAQKLGSSPEEIKKQIMDLILSHEIRALYDPKNDQIVIREAMKPSQYLLNTNSMIEAMENYVDKMTNDIPIIY